MYEIRTVDEVTMFARPYPGHVARWVRVVVAAAAVLGVVLLFAIAVAIWKLERKSHGSFWDRNAGPLAMLAAVAVAFAPPSRLSRFIRLAVALPVLHAVALVVAWRLYATSTWFERRLAHRCTLDDWPASKVVVALGAAIVGAAWLVARNRREVVHAAVTIALANLLLVGLWLPIAVRVGTPPSDVFVEPGARIAVLAVVPPLVVACAFAAVAQRDVAMVRRLRVPIALVLAGLLGAAAWAMWKPREEVRLTYETLAYFVLAAGALAIVATVVLGVSSWLGTLLDRRALTGDRFAATIDAEDDATDDVVALVAITSWLRGPSVLVRPFEATWRGGQVAVPSARLALGLPTITSALRVGEAAVVLRTGEAVAIGGMTSAASGEGPFRAADALLAGPRGAVVAPLDRSSRAVDSLALAAWRPSVAYVLCAATAMLPVLVGLWSQR